MVVNNKYARIAVGVDGSAASGDALEWAAAEAQMRDAVLEIDHVWSLPNLGYAGYISQLDDFESDAKALLDEIVANATIKYKDITIESNLLHGAPSQALIDRGKACDLVVVGSRGHGGFSGLMLGSVSQQLVHHASFPVVVIHPQRAVSI